MNLNELTIKKSADGIRAKQFTVTELKIVVQFEEMSDKLLLALLMLGFFLLSALLLTNHPGDAIKVSNYVYLFLAVVAFTRTIQNAKQK